MKDASLLRYSRQIMLPEFDIAGQQRLNEARVLVVGMGGLGCPAAMYLAAAGVGSLIIVDDDTVELTNLQRQIAHTERDLGQSKVESAKNTLAALNPEVDVLAINERVDAGRLCELAEQVDVVVDACDNFTTRFAVNAAAIQVGKPLVSGAAIRMEGQVAVLIQEILPAHVTSAFTGREGVMTVLARQMVSWRPLSASLVHCRHWKRLRSLPVTVNRWSAGC